MLFIISVLALLVATVASDSMQTLKATSQSGRDSQAKYAAYAGLELVMNNLRQVEQYTGEKKISNRHGQKDGQLGELSQVSYQVLIWNNMQEGSTGDGSGSSMDDSLDAAGGVKVRRDTVYMVSTGKDTVRGEEVLLASMAGTARRIRPVFEDAAYARNKIAMEGDVLVDAWDSQGGWVKYVAGTFPGATGGSGSTGGTGGGQQQPDPTVEDYKATVGTDGKDGRTMRLLSGSKLNGYFRVGPGISGEAFSEDSGSKSGSKDTVSYGVATATDPDNQVAGQKDSTGKYKFAKVDDKSTEMPRFIAPYDADDLSPAPKVDNPSSTKEVKDEWGNTVTQTVPPAPVKVEPGGYERIDVAGDQTLELSPGVYYFKEGMNVSGKIKLSGGDPVIVFIGEKAVFDGAEINKDGKTSSLQLCFTDELTEESEIDSLVGRVQGLFDSPTSPSSGGSGDDGPSLPTSSGGSIGDRVRNILVPATDPTDQTSKEGASLLEINGGSFHGSISGKNLVALTRGAEVYGGIMANVVNVKGGALHQDLALKGSNLMNSGGWSLEGVHQIR